MSLYLALRFRDGHTRDGPQIRVKVGFVWFEGVDDFHIQFDGPGADNYCPDVKRGQFLAPHPETGEMTALYSLEVSEKAPVETDRAPKGYVELLMEAWGSPNRSDQAKYVPHPPKTP